MPITATSGNGFGAVDFGSIGNITTNKILLWNFISRLGYKIGHNI